jgi:hypothetical protein
LNSDDLRSIKEYVVGDEFASREGLPNENCTWQVRHIERRAPGEPDVLFCDLVVTA